MGLSMWTIVKIAADILDRFLHLTHFALICLTKRNDLTTTYDVRHDALKIYLMNCDDCHYFRGASLYYKNLMMMRNELCGHCCSYFVSDVLVQL